MPWREQYDRMLRWKQRLWFDPIDRNEHALDLLYAFAQACLHLADWLENDRSQHVRREQAERYIASSPLLAFCRDVCHGSKHARLDAKKVRFTPKKIAESFSAENDSGETEEWTTERTEWFIAFEREIVDIENFAGRCIEEWNRFLIGEGLLGP